MGAEAEAAARAQAAAQAKAAADAAAAAQAAANAQAQVAVKVASAPAVAQIATTGLTGGYYYAPFQSGFSIGNILPSAITGARLIRLENQAVAPVSVTSSIQHPFFYFTQGADAARSGVQIVNTQAGSHSLPIFQGANVANSGIQILNTQAGSHSLPIFQGANVANSAVQILKTGSHSLPIFQTRTVDGKVQLLNGEHQLAHLQL